jgi:hypothetical protein
MKPIKAILPILILSLSACAGRPAYVGTSAPARPPVDSTPRKVPLRGVALKTIKTRNASRAAAAAVSEALRKDNECAILHDSLRSLRDQDASIRAFTARFGEAETRAMAGRVRSSYEAKGCAAWLVQRGGVGAAWRRVRVAQWTRMTDRKD